MTRNKLWIRYRLSIAIALLTTVQAAGGLLFPGSYRDNAYVRTAWRVNDLITLFLAVPILVAALILAWRGSRRAQFVWLGMLDYTLYNYAFYLFGAAFNRFFLLYAALFALSIYGLVFGLMGFDASAIDRDRLARPSVRWVSGYTLAIPLIFGSLWVTQSLRYWFTGEVPPQVVQFGHPTAIVFAIDLTLLLPAMGLSAVWLWRRRPWGLALATIVNVKGALYTFQLGVLTVFVKKAGLPANLAQLPVWFLLAMLSSLACVTLLRFAPPPTSSTTAG